MSLDQSLDQPVTKSAYHPHNAAQKQRRLELKVIHADERYRARYQALKAEMAALAQASQDNGRAAWITAILDHHVLRVRDRITLRDLTGLTLPLRPGGALDETPQQALKAIGDQSAELDRRDFGAPDYRDGDEEAALDQS